MTDILLITDVPRLRKVFSRLNDEQNLRLRITNSLERGGEEIAAEKPDMIFVQTHLFGLSGDILLTHLKKQLGRRRSRFVLLSSPENVTPEILKLYQYHLDTSLADNELFDSIRETIKVAFTKVKKTVEPPLPLDAENLDLENPAHFSANVAVPSSSALEVPIELAERGEEFVPMHAAAVKDSLEIHSALPQDDAQETNLTYTRPSRFKVYSEFTTSLESAVSDLEQPKIKITAAPVASIAYHPEHGSANPETVQGSSKKFNFLLWFAPLLIAVVAITMVQHRGSKPKTVDIAPEAVTVPVTTQKTAAPQAAVTPTQPAPTVTTTVLSPPVEKKSAKEPENEPTKNAVPLPKSAKRLVTLPNFVPKYGYDKKYGAAHPGWERYKGEVTEFKIFREDGAIKAIQVVDRGGHGVPESFMKGVLHQLARKPNLSIKGSEKKDGYEIQRGQVSDNLSAVYYRDADGGRLRAFVVTW